MARQTITMLAIALVALAGCIQPQEPQEDETEPTPQPSPTPTAPAEDCAPPEVEVTTGPSQASVANYPGSFSYSGQTTAQTGREVHLWENPSTGALVSWGGQAATGDLAVSIQDACGKVLYSANIGMGSQGGASEETQQSTPGDWYIVLEFTLFTGQMGLTVNSS